MSRLNRGLSAVLLLGAVASVVAQPLRVIDPKLYYLGTAGDPEWQEFAGKTPHGRRLDLKFTALANTNENTLFIRQRDVKLDWAVELNGRKLGKLFLSEQDLVQALNVPAGALLDGENTLAIIPPNYDKLATLSTTPELQAAFEGLAERLREQLGEPAR